jgi:hypothetical protein
MIKKLIVFALIYSSSTNSCELETPSEEYLTHHALEIYEGQVVSISLAKHEGEYIEAPYPPIREQNTAESPAYGTDFIVEVKVSSTTRGKMAELVTADISWCGGGSAEFLDFVKLYKLKHGWYVAPRYN